MYEIEYSRRPFFLRPNWNVEGWLDGLGLPLDATKAQVAEVNAQQGRTNDGIRRLFRDAGVHPDYDRAAGSGSGYSDTIDSHRLAGTPPLWGKAKRPGTS